MKRRWFILIIVLVSVWAWAGLGIDADRLDRAAGAAADFAGRMWPPDFSEGGDIWDALVETLQIAILATVFGVLLSVPVGLLAARNVFPAALATPIRLVATGIRVVPSLIWALFAVVIFGIGPLAGVIAMTFYTWGFLTKLQSEAIEGIPRDALDALRAMRATRFQQAWHVALPEAANALRSQTLFMFEYNVRNSSIVGLVGAGGLGMLMDVARDFHAWDRMMAYLLVLFATVIVVDMLSYLVRRRYIELAESPKARWKDILWPGRD